MDSTAYDREMSTMIAVLYRHAVLYLKLLESHLCSIPGIPPTNLFAVAAADRPAASTVQATNKDIPIILRQHRH